MMSPPRRSYRHAARLSNLGAFCPRQRPGPARAARTGPRPSRGTRVTSWPRPAWLPCRALRALYCTPFLAAAFSAAGTTWITSTLPPAFSTASLAPFDAPATVKLSLAVSSPLPSRRTPSLPPRARPAAFSAAWSSVAPAFELAGVDQLLDRAQVHLGIILGEDVVEAALRQPHVERHLAALEAGDRRRPRGSSGPSGRARRSCPCPSRCRARRASCDLRAPALSRISFSFMCALAFAFVALMGGAEPLPMQVSLPTELARRVS